MKTTIYMVRHAESPYIEGQERERGLSEQGTRAAGRVRFLLGGLPIDRFVSSPYERAVLTIREAAETRGAGIRLEEDLRERRLAGDDQPISGHLFREAKRRVYEDPEFAFPGGESSREAQARAVRVIGRLLREHAGEQIVIGTHGDIMTLILNHYDPYYDYVFWESTTMPDIYRLTFEGERLADVARLWEPEPV
ncbi:phosphoglycerate mutase [Paenibacillus sp. J31TS4]|uniref:histidine phosphatase family protein n=1 Tax=Paenibacillus sp. J31TS4 TaxID=2807195 RepID=UPI001B0369BF|nr:histidine phosphatase family protein [Paenibacillus sp. J31TS4]GIP39108.1 phosphoglycerate mutase [Paenibacillus sp. J31TS4]